ncbi:MAG: hypothetical protein ACAH83_17070 [Alphaproteobacteria bacterium]
MKYHLFIATALVSAVLLSRPAGAEAPAKAAAASNALPVAGVIDVKGGYRHMRQDDEPESDSHFALGANGRVSFPFSNMFSAQIDAQTEWFNVDDNGSNTPSANTLLGGHLSARNSSQWLIGGFAAVGIPTQTETEDSPEDDNSVAWEGGLEGQWYLNDFTFYGQTGFADMRADGNGPEGFVNGWFGRGVVRYFLNDDTMVNAEYSYGRTRHYVDGDDDGRIRNWGVGGATRVCNTHPLYGTLEYQGGKYDSTTEGEVGIDHAFLAGIKFQFGVNSLKHNDRYGATLDLPMLPVRATSWEESLD